MNLATWDVVLNTIWDVLSKGADIAGFISLVISIVTLANTKKIRSSILAHVETSEYKQAIDEQIVDLETFEELLVAGEGLESSFFLGLIKLLQNIKISYETILPSKLTKKITNLYDHINKNLYENSSPYSKKDIEKCISALIYIISELKKEKKVM